MAPPKFRTKTVFSGSVLVSVVLGLQTIGPSLLIALKSQDQFLAAFILVFLPSGKQIAYSHEALSQIPWRFVNFHQQYRENSTIDSIAA